VSDVLCCGFQLTKLDLLLLVVVVFFLAEAGQQPGGGCSIPAKVRGA
jgi:hypothetical protein